MRLEKHDLEAWDERFNHIDNCHFKQGERIDKWYPLDKDIPKGLLRNEHVLDSGAPSTVPEELESDSDSTDSTKRSDAPGQTQRASPLSAMPCQNSSSDRATPCASKDSVHVQTWNCVSL